MTTLDHQQIDNIVFDGIFPNDHPDYPDAFIASADYMGEPMTEEQLNELNEDSDFVYEKLMEYLN